MTLFLKYYHLLSPALYLELETKQERCILTTVSTPLDNPVEFAYELMYGGMLNTLRGLLNLPQIDLRVEVPYPAPHYSGMYYDVFGEDVHFDCPRGRVSFDSALLDTPH